VIVEVRKYVLCISANFRPSFPFNIYIFLHFPTNKCKNALWCLEKSENGQGHFFLLLNVVENYWSDSKKVCHATTQKALVS
jgi:hypothetical protein